MANKPVELLRHAVGKPRMGALPCQFFQKLLRAELRVKRIFGILIGQLIKRKITRIQNLLNVTQGLRIIGE